MTWLAIQSATQNRRGQIIASPSRYREQRRGPADDDYDDLFRIIIWQLSSQLEILVFFFLKESSFVVDFHLFIWANK